MVRNDTVRRTLK